MKVRKNFAEWLRVLVILVLCVVFLFPVYWVAITSFKPEAETVTWPPKLLPQPFTLDNYTNLLSDMSDTPVLLWFRNSLIAASCYSVLSVTISLLAGYAVARMEFWGKKLYVSLLLFAMAVPGIIMLFPSFIVVDALGWLDTFYAIILPHLSGTFGIILFAQFLKKFPRDLEEAAFIDGATTMQVLCHVIFPHVKPIALTLLVLGFMGNWNDYFWPFIVLFSPDMRTLPIGMATLQGRYEQFYGTMTAGAAIMALPSILLFACIMKYYVQAISMAGAIKE